MDLGRMYWCTINVILLFGAAMKSNGADSCTCLCSHPPRMEFTETPGASYCCEHNKYRYKCIDGYTRKAGTSNLIKCEKMENDQYEWTSASLECIRDPKLPAPVTTTQGYSETMASTKATQQQESTETETQEVFMNTTYKPTRETKSADPTCRTTSSISTSTPVAEKESSVDSISDPQSTATVITGVSVVGILIFALGTGLVIFLYKRRSHNNDPQTADEQLPMNPIPQNAPSDPSDTI